MSQERRGRSAKSLKDVEQAREPVAAMRARDPEATGAEIDEARGRGPTWRKRVDAAMAILRWTGQVA